MLQVRCWPATDSQREFEVSLEVVPRSRSPMTFCNVPVAAPAVAENERSRTSGSAWRNMADPCASMKTSLDSSAGDRGVKLGRRRDESGKKSAVVCAGVQLAGRFVLCVRAPRGDPGSCGHVSLASTHA